MSPFDKLKRLLEAAPPTSALRHAHRLASEPDADLLLMICDAGYVRARHPGALPAVTGAFLAAFRVSASDDGCVVFTDSRVRRILGCVAHPGAFDAIVDDAPLGREPAPASRAAPAPPPAP